MHVSQMAGKVASAKLRLVWISYWLSKNILALIGQSLLDETNFRTAASLWLQAVLSFAEGQSGFHFHQLKN